MADTDAGAGADAAAALPPAAAAERAAVAGISRERRRFVHTTEAQRRCVVEWLEQPPNFQLLARRAAPVRTADGRKLKKADGFRALTRHVNACTDAKWDLETTRSRYESLLQTYSKARRAVERPDFALSAADRARGVKSLRQKRETLCLFYDRLDALHRTGDRALERTDDDDDDDGDREEAAESTDPPLPVTEVVQRESPSNGALAAAPVTTAVVETARETRETVLMGVQDAAPKPLASSAATIASPPPKRPRHQYASPADVSSRRASVEPSSRRSSMDPASRRSSMDPGALVGTLDSRRSSLVDSYHHHTANDEADGAPAKSDALAFEAQRLVLLQEQLQLQKRELDIKERELAAQEAMRKQTLRAELTTKLVVAGKSLDEIRAYLALLDG